MEINCNHIQYTEFSTGKNEIFDLLMGYLDMGIAMVFYTKEETKEIENLEKEYWIQSDN